MSNAAACQQTKFNIESTQQYDLTVSPGLVSRPGRRHPPPCIYIVTGNVINVCSVMFAFMLTGLLLLASKPTALLGKDVFSSRNLLATNQINSLNVSSCPGKLLGLYIVNLKVNVILLGYTLGSLSQSKTGLTAHLSLAGVPCNAFGQDIVNLTIQVTYESASRYTY
jgi:hypothetical protein